MHSLCMTGIGEALERRRELLSLTQQELAARAGVSLSALGKWERSERYPRKPSLERLARALNCTVADIASGRPPPDADFPPDPGAPITNGKATGARNGATATRKIIEYDVQLSAGFGSVAAEEAAIAEWAVPRTWLPRLQGKNDECVVVEVVGDSMAPEFHAGDRVLIDTANRRPTPPGYFALWDGLGTVIKQVEHIPHSDPPTLRIKSRNPEYETYEREAEDVQIAGRVIGLMRRL